ncbi:MAG: type II toxin-antitoxin system HipA family toxin [Bacteroidetes bacterium]|nr:type II toxin-antitoxin system HipA family toxin [Bacteroidota bacterium]
MNRGQKILTVSIWGQTLGKLALTPNNVCVFEYDIDYLKKGVSISPFYLPLRDGLFTAKQQPFDGLFGVFADSLPDGWGNLLIDRLLKKHQIQPASLNILDRLSLVGNNGMGALSYHPQIGFKETEDNSNIKYLAAEVEKILNENYNDSLELLFNKAGSSGGARPKVLLTVDGKQWLVKFRSSLDPENIGQIEYQYSLIAKKCGILMPETRLFEDKYFGVQRFDREGKERFHVHTASGLLYASHRFPSLDYTELLKACMAISANMEEVERMFRLMVFNVLTGNKDDHAKNFSFLLKDKKWILSPAYDLVPSSGFNDNHSTTIAGQGNPDKKDLFKVAENVGFPPKKAINVFDEVYEGCKEIRVKGW